MPETSARKPPVVIVGGGWAGLAAAVNLCRHKQPVLVLESARQLGGRARSVRSGDHIVDNGQHLMIGAYQSLLTLMGEAGVDPEQSFERLPLTLRMFKGPATSLQLHAWRLPAPLHILAGLFTARGLSAREQLQAIRFGHRLLKLTFTADADISVQALLHSEGQSPGLMRKLWAPLCIATLNTPIDIASARLFIKVLKTTFGEMHRHSDLLIPRKELSDILPRPCAQFIETHDGQIELGQRVTALKIEHERISAICIGDRVIDTEQVILATPHVVTRRLLAHHSATGELAGNLADLGHEPISTLYLQYPEDIRLPVPMIGIEDSLAQWVFDRRVCGQSGMMAVVISARGAHKNMPAQQLIDKVIAELAASFPHWPAPHDVQLIREKRATFCARVGVDAKRPTNRTPVNGLWLAGDYTATELPATLESAVNSGINCARQILRERRH